MPDPAVRTASRVDDLPSGWDDLAGPEDLFLTTRWLRVVEATHDAPLHYLWVERDGRPCAALAAILADGGAPWVMGRPDAILAQAVQDGLPGAADVAARIGGAPRLAPSLAIGGRHLGNTRLLTDGRADAGDRARLLAAALALAEESGAVSVALPYLGPGDTELAGLLAGRGFVPFTSGRYSTLAVPSGGFAGYLAGQTPRHRVLFRAERRKIEQAGVRVELRALSEVEDLAELARLETGLLAKYGISWELDHATRILRLIGERLGADARVMTAHAEGAVRGFAVVLVHGTHWYTRQAGFDYDFQRRARLPLYFELGFHRMIDEAAAAGAEVIHYGLGSDGAKERRGAVAVDQRCWVRLLDEAPGGGDER